MIVGHHHVSSYFLPILCCFYSFMLGLPYCSRHDDCWSSPCEQFYFCLFYAIFYDLMKINPLLTVWNVKKYRCLLLTLWAVRFGYISSFLSVCCFIALKKRLFYVTGLLTTWATQIHQPMIWYRHSQGNGQTSPLTPTHFKAGCIRQMMFIQRYFTCSHSYTLWTVEK